MASGGGEETPQFAHHLRCGAGSALNAVLRGKCAALASIGDHGSAQQQQRLGAAEWQSSKAILGIGRESSRARRYFDRASRVENNKASRTLCESSQRATGHPQRHVL